MKRITLLLSVFATSFLHAQFKADNVTYKTVFPEDLCKTLMANQGYLLLDVRSQGEYDDTSLSSSLNIGRVKNSMHIDIRELPQRWKELSSYKDKPLFIYCSHSQRSRRASRMLADSGFTKVYNINGGLTDFYKQSIQSNPCAGYEIVTSVPYKIISPKQLNEKIKSNQSYYIIDLRKDSAFRAISLSEKIKAEGRFNDAINIPFEKLMAQDVFSFSNKPILLVDEFGNESPKAAEMLVKKGMKDVTILFNGMDAWLDYIVNTTDKPAMKWSSPINFNLLPAEKFNKMVNEKKDFILIDTRSADEFNNRSKNYWQNIGQIKSAINIPFSELATSALLPASKETPVIVYGFNSQEDIFSSAKWLKDHGYKNVSVLQGGIWSLRWTSHNIKGKEQLNDLVVNVPAENL